MIVADQADIGTIKRQDFRQVVQRPGQRAFQVRAGDQIVGRLLNQFRLHTAALLRFE